MMAATFPIGVEEPIDGISRDLVCKLPLMAICPNYHEIIAAIDKLNVNPLSWSSRSAKQPISDKDQKACARYLTSIISNDLVWLPLEQRESILEMASAGLAKRCGRTATGDLTRAWSLRPDLTILTHEPALTGDNLGLKTWASAYLLAKRLKSIEMEHNLQVPSANRAYSEVLELGSGTGLVGLAAAAIWKCRVILSDLPEIIPNLEANVRLNKTTITNFGGHAEARSLDWSQLDDEADETRFEHFQFILAADPLYSPKHAPMLAKVVDKNLQRGKDARFVIELPYRDEATKVMASHLRSILNKLEFELLDQGEEFGYDDWEEGGEAAEVHCWWGIWGRRMNVNLSEECDFAQ